MPFRRTFAFVALPIVLMLVPAAASGAPSFLPKADFGTAGKPQFVEVEDLNGDGDLDLVVSNREADSVSVLLGDGSGGFGTKNDFPTATFPGSIAVGDLNGDGDLDLAVGNSESDVTNSAAVSVLLSDGSGGFGAKTDFDTGTGSSAPGDEAVPPRFVAIGDLNNDGRLDLAVTDPLAPGSDGRVSVLLGDGLGGFATKTQFATVGFPSSVSIDDLDGDGSEDLLVTGANPGGAVSVLLGDGNGGFEPKSDYATGSFPVNAAIDDFDGDGDLDLATSNLLSGSVSVLLGDGLGGFGTKTDVPVGPRPLSVKSEDLDNDGILDLAVTVEGSNVVSVLAGNGLGGFGSKTDFTTGGQPWSVAIDDVDADGRPDLAVANANGGSVSLLLGDGTGGFPTARPDKDRLRFGRVSDAPAVRTVTIRSGAGAPLEAGQAGLSGGDAGDFGISGDTCSTETIPAGDACEISVSFDAAADGFKRAVLLIPSDAADSPLKVALSGFRDTVDPVAQIDSGPSGPTNDATPTFTFSADESAVFECRLFEQGTTAPGFDTCSGPANEHTVATDLAEGEYAFEVRAIDNAGNAGSAARSEFSVDTTAPKTVVGPASGRPTFQFSSSEPDSTFECSVNGGQFSTCASPVSVDAASAGTHRFKVRAIDPAGNPDPAPPVRKFGARIGKLKVSGPSRAGKGKRATFRVAISNPGNVAATGVRIRVSGRGAGSGVRAGRIPAGGTRTVKVGLRPNRAGRAIFRFRVTSGNAGGKSVKKTVTVKKRR